MEFFYWNAWQFLYVYSIDCQYCSWPEICFDIWDNFSFYDGHDICIHFVKLWGTNSPTLLFGGLWLTNIVVHLKSGEVLYGQVKWSLRIQIRMLCSISEIQCMIRRLLAHFEVTCISNVLYMELFKYSCVLKHDYIAQIV